MQNGDIIHNWTIIDCSKLSHVTAKCSCGEIKVMRAWNIRNGQPKKCRNCYDKERILQNLLPIGSQFGEWTIISDSYERKGSKTGGIKQEVQCKCGYRRFLELSPLKAGRTISCKRCSIERMNKDFQEIPSSYMRQIKASAVRRRYRFEISFEMMWNLYIQQNKKCKLSGVSISFEDKTASLDRIDSTKGYIEGNVQWLHKVVNQMKSNRTDQDFVEWCKLIFKNNK